jgi:peptide subunit release factor 1 (eRF1)
MAEFYQKVKQEIEKGISAVSIKSKEVLENMKLNKQVETIQSQIAIAEIELGQLVYFMITRNNFDQVKIAEKCTVITELHKQLTEKESELSQLHMETGAALGKMYCNQCKTELSEGSQYCGQCGGKVPDQAKDATE